jgi:hypothetical protein
MTNNFHVLPYIIILLSIRVLIESVFCNYMSSLPWECVLLLASWGAYVKPTLKSILKSIYLIWFIMRYMYVPDSNLLLWGRYENTEMIFCHYETFNVHFVSEVIMNWFTGVLFGLLFLQSTQNPKITTRPMGQICIILIIVPYFLSLLSGWGGNFSASFWGAWALLLCNVTACRYSPSQRLENLCRPLIVIVPLLVVCPHFMLVAWKVFILADVYLKVNQYRCRFVTLGVLLSLQTVFSIPYIENAFNVPIYIPALVLRLITLVHLMSSVRKCSAHTIIIGGLLTGMLAGISKLLSGTVYDPEITYFHHTIGLGVYWWNIATNLFHLLYFVN